MAWSLPELTNALVVAMVDNSRYPILAGEPMPTTMRGEMEDSMARLAEPIYQFLESYVLDPILESSYQVKTHVDDPLAGYLGSKIDDVTIKYSPWTYQLYVDQVPVATSVKTGGVRIGAQPYLYMSGSNLMLRAEIDPTLVGGNDMVPTSRAVKLYVDAALIAGGSGGDMFKSTYDTGDSGVVDDSERLGNELPAYYLAWTNITGTPTTIAGYGITNAYTETEIDAFFEGEDVGKKQVDWARITNKPAITNIPDPGNNRVLTSDGTATGIVAEPSLLFDGSLLTVSGSLIFATGATVDTIETTLTDDDTHIPTSGAVFDAIDSAVAVENLWDRTGTVLSPHNVGDDVELDGNIYLNTDVTVAHTDRFIYWGDATDGWDTYIVEDADDRLNVYVGGALRLQFNSNYAEFTDKAIMVTDEAYAIATRLDNSSQTLGNIIYSNTGSHGVIFGNTHYGGTRGATAVSPSNSAILLFRNYLYDGSSSLEVARISASGIGTVSTGFASAHIHFYTRDTTGSLTERMNISSSGVVQIHSADSGQLSVDIINERSVSAGVTVEGIKMEDGNIFTEHSIPYTFHWGSTMYLHQYIWSDTQSASLINRVYRVGGTKAIPVVAPASSALYHLQTFINDGTSDLEVARMFITGVGAVSTGSASGEIRFYVRNATAALTEAVRINYTGVLGVDTIQELTSASGVTIDGVLLKDGGITLATGPAVNEIEITLTDDDSHLPTSGAVVDAITAAGYWTKTGIILSPTTLYDYIKIRATTPTYFFTNGMMYTDHYIYSGTASHTHYQRHYRYGGSVEVPVAAPSGSEVTDYLAYAYDGTSDINIAYIKMEIYGSVATNDIAGELVFSTRDTGTGGTYTSMVLREDGLEINNIIELTSSAGVFIEGVHLKDNHIGVNTSIDISVPIYAYHGSANFIALLESGDAGAYIEFKDNSTATAPYVGAVGNDLRLNASSGVVYTDVAFEVDTINEYAVGAGVTIDSLLIKDGNIGTSSLFQGNAYLTSWYLRSDTNNAYSYAYVYSANAGHCDSHYTYRYGGTVASPAVTPSSSYITYQRGFAYDGTAVREVVRAATAVDGAVADDNVAGRYDWLLRPSGVAASLGTKMRLNQTGLLIDVINELTSGVGVTIEGGLVKDTILGDASNYWAGLFVSDITMKHASGTSDTFIFTSSGDDFYVRVGTGLTYFDEFFIDNAIRAVDNSQGGNYYGLLSGSSVALYVNGVLINNMDSTGITTTEVVYTDQIDEYTSTVGVTIDGGLLKDNIIGDASNYWTRAYIRDMYMFDSGGTTASRIYSDNIDIMRYRAGSGENWFDTASISNRIRVSANHLGSNYYISITGYNMEQFYNGALINAWGSGGIRTSGVLETDDITEITTDAGVNVEGVTFRDSYGWFSEITAPTAPAVNTGYLYMNTTDEHIYFRNSSTTYDLTLTGGGAGLSWTGSGNNKIGTWVDADTINAEDNLQFDGSTLVITGTWTASGVSSTITQERAIFYNSTTGAFSYGPDGGGSTTTFLRGDGSWQTPSGSGNVSNTGTPLNDQIAVWTTATVIEGTTGLTYASAVLGVTGTLTVSAITASPAQDKVLFYNSSTGAINYVDGLGSTTNFLRGDGSWAIPTGSGGINWFGSTSNGVGTYLNSTQIQAEVNLTWADNAGLWANITSGTVVATFDSTVTSSTTDIRIDGAASSDTRISFYGNAVAGVTIGYDISTAHFKIIKSNITFDSAENIAIFKVDDSVDLYYDGSRTFRTQSYGALIDGTLTGTTNLAYIGFYETGGTTRQGYIGVGSASTDDMHLFSDVGNIQITPGTAGYVNVNVTSNTIVQFETTAGTASYGRIRINAATAGDTMISWSESASSKASMGWDAGTATLRIVKGFGVLDTLEDMAIFDPDGAVTLFWDDSKKFETTTIGVTITGQATSTGDMNATDFNLTSDARLKDIYSSVDNGLDLVMKLNPINFRWKDHRDDYVHIGLIAQEVQDIRPELVKIGEDNFLSLSYINIVTINTAAIQELNGKIDTVEDRLRSEIIDLKKRVKELENVST